MGALMPSIDNGQGYSLSRRRLFVIAICAIAITIIFIAVFFSNVSKKPSDEVNLNEYFDSASGETISSPDGKTPESYGIDEDSEGISYLGFSKFLELGLTTFQVEAVKIGFDLFSDKTTVPITEVSVFVNSAKQDTVSTDRSTKKIIFETLVNRKDKYSANISYSGLKDARLLIISNNKVVFDSGFINIDEYDYHDDADIE